MKDVQFWLSQAGYVLLRFYARKYGCTAFPSLTPVSAVGSLSAFILVFFTSQAWSRFMQMYNLAMSLEGRIFDLTLLIQNLLPPAAVWRVWRHINAAHCLTYIGASGHYTEDNLLKPLNARYNLLCDDELERLRAIGLAGGGATREVLSWVVTCIEEHMPAEHGNTRKQAVLDQVLRFRSAQGSIMDYVDLPFPFIYVSFVNVVCILYPALFSLATALSFDNQPRIPIAWGNEVIGYLSTLLNTIFFLGMHSIARVFQDPFENSYEDLSVLHYCRFEAEASAKILLRAKATALDAQLEHSMAGLRDWRKLLGKHFAPDQAPEGAMI